MHVKDEDLITKLSEQIEGADLDAAVYARVDTPLGKARWLTPIGNYLVARPAARSAAHDMSEEVDVPLDAAMVLGVAGADLHVWSADPMLSQVKDHLGSVPLTRLAGIDATPGKSWWELKFSMADGESFELQARGDVRSFVDAALDERAS
jgi:hypothetical protein